MDILFLIFGTILAWLVHLLIASRYVGLFSSAKSLKFRITHAAEVAAVVAVLLIFYERPGVLATVLTILLTLVVLDIILFSAYKSVRQKFSWTHVLTAYTVITIVILLSKNT